MLWILVYAYEISREEPYFLTSPLEPVLIEITYLHNLKFDRVLCCIIFNIVTVEAITKCCLSDKHVPRKPACHWCGEQGDLSCRQQVPAKHPIASLTQVEDDSPQAAEVSDVFVNDSAEILTHCTSPPPNHPKQMHPPYKKLVARETPVPMSLYCM